MPGFRKGKVPRQVLLQRIGKERLMTEAVESHIGGWFWNAAAQTRVRPVEQPQYDFELPDSAEQDWEFSATVAVQAKPELPDWTQLEVGAVAAEVPEERVQQELDALRATVAAARAVTSAWSYAGATSTTSAPTMVMPSSPRSRCSSSRLLRPPISGVPVPGAKAGSRTSTSTERKTGPGPTRSTARATTSTMPRSRTSCMK